MSVEGLPADMAHLKGLRKEVAHLAMRSERQHRRKDGVEDSGFADESVSSQFDSVRRTQCDDGYGSLSLSLPAERTTVGEASDQAITTQLRPISTDETDRAPAEPAFVVSAFTSSVRQALAAELTPKAEESRDVFTENTHYHDYACSGDALYLLAPYRQLLSVPNDDGDTALHLSVLNNKSVAVRQFLTLRPYDYDFIDQTNYLGQTALHLAIITNQPEVVGNLLSAGADPAKTDRNGNTSLHLAARSGLSTVVSSLLVAAVRRRIDKRTLLEQRNYEGLTALHLATRGSHSHVMSLLVDEGADVDCQDLSSGRSVLHQAVENNQLTMASMLIFSLGANVDALTFDGCTPMHLAAGLGYCDMVAVLLAAGADPAVKNAEDDLPLDLTRDEQIISILQKL